MIVRQGNGQTQFLIPSETSVMTPSLRGMVRSYSALIGFSNDIDRGEPIVL